MRQRGLFDSPAAPARPPGPGAPSGQPKDLTGPGQPKALTVTELTRRIKTLLEGGFPELWVEGELSNFKRYESGHCYFTMKDAGAQLSCVLWRMNAARLRFTPADGLKVLARGKVGVYEPRGQYQFIVDRLEPSGLGALFAAFEALKAKLAAEGLFDPARKRPLPAFPQRIGLVTSASGAAVRDLMKIILGRWPALELVLVPVRVQGEGAAQEIADGIALANQAQCADVLIVGRGGGSLEDLWAFNEEVVAQAIAASGIPVVSAVGHEVDFTIADFVADVRAATPSHAGELVVPELAAVEEQLARLAQELPQALLNRVGLARAQLKALSGSWALKHPEERVQQLRQRVDEFQARLEPLARRAVQREADRLAALAARLDGLSPLRVLERGYSMTLRERDAAVVRLARDVQKGERLVTRLRDGRIVSRVEDNDGIDSP